MEALGCHCSQMPPVPEGLLVAEPKSSTNQVGSFQHFIQHYKLWAESPWLGVMTGGQLMEMGRHAINAHHISPYIILAYPNSPYIII